MSGGECELLNGVERISAASIGAQRCCSEHGVALRVIESNLSLE